MGNKKQTKKRIHCDNCNEFVNVPNISMFNAICPKCMFVRIPKNGRVNRDRPDRRFV